MCSLETGCVMCISSKLGRQTLYEMGWANPNLWKASPECTYSEPTALFWNGEGEPLLKGIEMRCAPFVGIFLLWRFLLFVEYPLLWPNMVFICCACVYSSVVLKMARTHQGINHREWAGKMTNFRLFRLCCLFIFLIGVFCCLCRFLCVTSVVLAFFVAFCLSFIVFICLCIVASQKSWSKCLQYTRVLYPRKLFLCVYRYTNTKTTTRTTKIWDGYWVC